MKSELKELPQRLLPWFEDNRRDLPWRRDREPYHIWVSEIMLQQTRVEAVKGYYARFLQALPTVEALARAPEDQLRKLWEGLGYYTRVRNLKKAAQVLVEQYGGRFPQTYDPIRSLPGIGDYTAGALCSIAFEQPTPAVDGNVLRVLARLREDREPIDLPAVKKRVRGELEQVYPAGRCGDFTQALMELGATVCLPNGAPLCGKCPLEDLCRAKANSCTAALPVRLPKRARRLEEKTVFVLRCAGRFALERRQDRGLLAGLWQFPNVPEWLDAQQALEAVEGFGLQPCDLGRCVERTHIFTHVQWRMRCYFLSCQAPEGPFTWLTAEEIDRDAALPTAFRMFWEEQRGMGLEQLGFDA